MKYLIVGLGNIGYEYVDTRHNVGFSVLDAWAQASNTSFKTERYGDVAEVKFKGRTFVLLKPSTYMNLSGKAVSYWLNKTALPIEKMMVVVDDMALAPGLLRIRKGGSAGGHNGLGNIAQVLGTENYPRLRVGIGTHIGYGSQVDFVLGKWTPEEKPIIEAACKRAISALKSFAMIGIDKTMSEFNKKEVPVVVPPSEDKSSDKVTSVSQ